MNNKSLLLWFYENFNEDYHFGINLSDMGTCVSIDLMHFNKNTQKTPCHASKKFPIDALLAINDIMDEALKLELLHMKQMIAEMEAHK